MKLETDRLYLRPWCDEDAESLYRYAKDERVGPIAGWPPHTSKKNSLEIIHGVLSAPETYAVVLKETNEPVGSIGAMFKGAGSAPIEEEQAEIGYWIGVPYWGKGLIPEAVEALLCRCFSDLGKKAVWCGYYDGNEKSKRVQEKCGFFYHHKTENAPSPMGDLRTEHFTFMTKAQWEGRKRGVLTDRLELVPLTSEQLRLWLTDLEGLEKEINISYKATPLEGVFKEVVKGQYEAVLKDNKNYIWNTFWFLIRREDRNVVGSAVFKGLPNQNGEAEIGYGLGDTFTGKGYMTEAVDALCRFALAQPGVLTVLAETDADGIKSQHILERCGFEEYKTDGTVWWRKNRQTT